MSWNHDSDAPWWGLSSGFSPEEIAAAEAASRAKKEAQQAAEQAARQAEYDRRVAPVLEICARFERAGIEIAPKISEDDIYFGSLSYRAGALVAFSADVTLKSGWKYPKTVYILRDEGIARYSDVEEWVTVSLADAPKSPKPQARKPKARRPKAREIAKTRKAKAAAPTPAPASSAPDPEPTPPTNSPFSGLRDLMETR